MTRPVRGTYETAVETAIGERILALRKSRNWTQQHLADASGVKRSHIASLEIGRVACTVPMLLRIAAAFGLAPARLLPGREETASTMRTGT